MKGEGIENQGIETITEAPQIVSGAFWRDPVFELFAKLSFSAACEALDRFNPLAARLKPCPSSNEISAACSARTIGLEFFRS
jgi:hypothetical protein